MPSSRAAAGGIAGLARNFATQGPAEALRPFNLEGLAGAPAVDVFVALTDALCPPGGTIDEAIARDAMLETIAALAAEGVGNFDEMTPEDLQSSICVRILQGHDLALLAAAAGLGISLVRDPYGLAFSRSLGLVPVHEQRAVNPNRFHVVTRPGQRHPAMQRLITRFHQLFHAGADRA